MAAELRCPFTLDLFGDPTLRTIAHQLGLVGRDERVAPVPGCPDYLVSDLGAVFSLKRGAPHKLRPHERADGYCKVVISAPDGQPRSEYVHHLVMFAFRGPRPEGMQIAHNDGDRGHNALANLRFATPEANAADKHRHNTAAVGERSAVAKLSDDDVRALRAWYPAQTQGELADRFGVSQSHVSDVVTGKCRSNVAPGPVPDDYQPSRRKPGGLTPHKVRTTRKLIAAGHSQTAVAAAVGCSRPTISALVNHKTWREVGDDPCHRDIVGWRPRVVTSQGVA